MKSKTKKIKLLILFMFAGLAIYGLLNNNRIVQPVGAFSTGPPAGVTGAPGENSCTGCHSGGANTGQFSIIAPASYTPGQTYQIQVRHQTSDSSRKRWGFELTGLAGSTPVINFSSLDATTQVIDGAAGRKYIEHTLTGSFGNQQGGAQWTFNWTAPSSNIGPVTLYAAGNQANNDGSSDGDQIYLTSATIQPPVTAPTPPTPYDFDGDHKTDIGIFRASDGSWWYSRSSDTQTRVFTFGTGTDVITPGDYTGDGKADIAIFRPSTGEWYVQRSEDNSFFSYPFGTLGDMAVPADYDGDGKTDSAVFRPSSATWFIRRSSDFGTSIVTFGAATDKPVPADFDGDGKADVAIFRPDDGSWWYLRSIDLQYRVFRFGLGTDKPVQGDFTGDGKADIAIWRPATGEWFIQRSEDNSFFSVPFGASGDVPTPGDYDGDGKFDTAVFRPDSATWFVNRSTAGILIATFGSTGDRPIPSAFIP